MRLLPVRSGHVEALAYAPDGSHLAACANPWGRLWLWDLCRGEVGLIREGASNRALAHSPSSDVLALAGLQQLGLRDRRSGHLRYFLNPSRHQSGCLAFTPDGQTVVSAGVDERHAACILLGDVATGRERKLPVPVPPGTAALAITADASVILWREPPVHRVPAYLSLWHVPGRRRLARLSLGTTPGCAAFGPTRRHLALGVEDLVLLYDVGAVIEAFEASAWSALTLPFRRKRAAAVAKPKVLEGHEGPVQALAFTPDGATLFSGGRDRAVRGWDVASARPREAWAWPVGVVYALAVAPDGMTAAAGGNGGRTAIWDLTWF